MRVTVHAVGKMKAGPERDLAERFLDRFGKVGMALGIEFAGVMEINESRAQSADERKRDEAARIAEKLLPGSNLILLDERGRNLGSTEFADHLRQLNDGGIRDTAVVVGGPDGLDPAFREKAQLVIAFGKATWPHQLVRVMLAEQLYRAATVIAGHPYHRI